MLDEKGKRELTYLRSLAIKNVESNTGDLHRRTSTMYNPSYLCTSIKKGKAWVNGWEEKNREWISLD